MASLEKRGNRFRLIFRYAGRRHAHTLTTTDSKTAEILRGGAEKTLMLLEQQVLRVPEGVSVADFIVSDGKAEPPRPMPVVLTLQQLRDRFKAHAAGKMEDNSLNTVMLHLRHFERTLGVRFRLPELTMARLQEHIDRRAKKKYRGRPLSPATLRKEIASFRAVWNWAVPMGLVTGVFPHRGVRYPKGVEKLPFQTRAEIERRLALGGLTDVERRDLWDCLFLTLPEIDEVLALVNKRAAHPFIYPMFCFAAHTGTRRSEILRTGIADVDLDGAAVTLHERKRAKGKRTTRRVFLSDFLRGVLKDWLAVHPGGPSLFCHGLDVERSKKDRTGFESLTRDEANDHFKRTLAGTRWKKLRGWHTFRHSFCSNCALKGLDQRIIDAWMGHQTEEMRRRYRHLFPDQQREAIRSVFG